ncbi:MAG: DNA-directed RNA polymerase subunit alpha [Christensenella sp.]|nr:DNA-directed RNA polymerase subunit alpha [Christensenella sp.]
MIKVDVKKPRIECKEIDAHTTEFVVEPLERGFGTTLGNCFRRILLGTLPGAAPVAIKIEGAPHELACISGVKEDITDIILNIKSLAVKANTEDPNFTAKCVISKHTPGVVTAADIVCPADVEIINKDLVICTLDDNASIDMAIKIGAGRGYVSANEHIKSHSMDDTSEFGVIDIDSIYTPVETASYKVETARQGADMSYEKLTVSVTTNGAMTPTEAISYAASYMSNQVNLFVNLSENMKDVISLEAQEDEAKTTAKVQSVEELDLSCRSYNCLKRMGIHTVQDLVKKSEDDLIKARNLGKKSIEEIKVKLEELGLCLKNKEE